MTAFESALVTGATGFIGAHLVRRLVERGVSTCCLVRGGVRSPRVQRCLAGAQQIELPSIRAEDIADALQGVSCQAVFHLASPDILYGRDNPAEMVDVNVNLVTRLLAAVSHWPLRVFIHTGTFSEYGPLQTDRLTEETPLAPASVYGASKAAAFLCGRSVARQLQMPFVNLRLFGVYGPGEAARRLVPYLVGRLSRGEPAELTAGKQVLDLLYVDDVVDALCTAAAAPALEDDVYNVCSGQPVSVREVAELVARQLDASPRLLRFGAQPYRSDNFHRIIGDNSRFAAATGWQARWDLAGGIAETIRLLGQPNSVERPAA